MDADPANILITTGGLETLNFVCQLFIPSIKSFDKTGNVIFADSFSKCVAPGLRISK